MTVSKFVIQAALIAVVVAGPARGDVIRTQGLFASVPTPGFVAPASSGSSHNLAPASTNFVAPPPAASFPTAVYRAPAPAAYDAVVNFGNGPFADSGSLTTGNPRAWSESPKILGLFGGHPTAQQMSAFDNAVLQRVQQTFQSSGVPVSLTDNPNAPAAHVLSVVSNAVNPSLGGAIGMTNIGGNGFHFIDNSASFAGSVDQLEWIVAHNVAHELMLAFGVPEVHDQSGRFIDSTTAPLSTFLNPTARFSPGAVQDLLSRDFQQFGGSSFASQAQLVGPEAVPEPATLAAWACGTLAAIAARRARSRRLGA